MLLHLDGIARRYGVRPSALLHGSGLDLGLDALCAHEGRLAEAAAIDRACSDGGMVFPAVILAGG